jgi:hypothetical protein
MAVENRPTDPNLSDLTWAESGNEPEAENSDLPEKPSNEFIADGYGNKNVLPHAQFNWLIRSMMRWIRWLVSKVDGHVHDGGTSAGSVTKVNATNHLDWGANGTFGTTINTNAVHEIEHGGGATTKRIVTGQLRTATIQATGTGAAATVNVRDSAGNNGLLNSAIIQTGEIRRNGVGGTINVRDSAGSNNVTLNALNTPIAIGRTKDTSNGFESNFKGFLNSIYSSNPQGDQVSYAIGFQVAADTIPSNLLIFVQPIPQTNILPCVRISNLQVSGTTGQFLLKIHNLFDSSFVSTVAVSCSIVIYNTKF